MPITTFADHNIDIEPWERGERKKLCPECSHARRNSREKCLSVNVEQGIWNCHHCGWHGNLGYEREHRMESFMAVQRTYVKPAPLVTAKPLEDWAMDWLRGRGISEEVATDFGLFSVEDVYFPDLEKSARAIAFPYFRTNAEGERELINIKYRGPGKHFVMVKDAEKIFYNLTGCQGAQNVIIVEGEMDALALATAGITEVMSIPTGGTDKQMVWLQSGTPIFERAASVILAADMDQVGRELEERIANALGRNKLQRVRWPEGCKDANDTLLSIPGADGTPDLTAGAEAVRLAIANARYYPVGGAIHFIDLLDDLKYDYYNAPSRGFSTGWATMDTYYTVMPGELTIVTGIPGHGKSEWCDSLMVNLIRQHGWPFALYSPENYPPKKYAAKLIRKWRGQPFRQGYSDRMAWSDAESAAIILNDHIGFINPDEPNLTALLKMAEIFCVRMGTRGLVIDPWNEIEHNRVGNNGAMTETEYISHALRTIREFARDHDLHVWVIAHPTKMPKQVTEDGSLKYEVPGPYNISGSANWNNKADNIITIYRDKLKRELPTEAHILKIRDQPWVGHEGMVRFHFNPVTTVYTDIPEHDVIDGSVVYADAQAAD